MLFTHFSVLLHPWKVEKDVLMWIVPTYLNLRVTGFWMAGNVFYKGKHRLAHLGHARNQLGFCGIWILKWGTESIRCQIKKKSSSIIFTIISILTRECVIIQKTIKVPYCQLFTVWLGLCTMWWLPEKKQRKSRSYTSS